MITFERHHLGPRVHVLGRRIHEWHLGLAVLAGAWLVWWTSVVDNAGLALLLTGGGWLVIKDWRDIFPATRDTAAWCLVVHRRATRLRSTRRGEGLPGLAAAAAALTGVVNLLSALAPGIAWHGHLLLDVRPIATIPVFHALAVPTSAALIITAFYLARRRRRALETAVATLALLALFDLLKGFDLEEAMLSTAVAVALWWGRDAFYVRHDPIRLRGSMWRVPALGLGAYALTALSAFVAAPHAGAGAVLRAAGDLLVWDAAPVRFSEDISWVPVAGGLLGVLCLVVAAYTIFRPLAAPRSLPDPELRDAAADLVRRHGSDTLSFFKLRSDTQYLFSADGRAFVGYRIDNGVLLVAGDPVGPDEALPGMIAEVCQTAERHGLELAVIAASERLLPLWREAGLRGLYLGDEAIVDTSSFSLEGRAVRKIRQSVSRLEKSGYVAELVDVEALDERSLDELERVSELWRDGAAERGFSMAMDSLGSGTIGGGVVVLARSADGTAAGYIHFVPAHGRAAMSLSSMRRDRATPNGLMEFLVVRALEGLRERGIEEVSLNFAAFARLLHGPRSPATRLLGRLVALANPYFQIESLYRFNAKFSPRWEPRYLLFERARRLPRVGLAALWTEGQLPRTRWRGACRAD